MKWKKWKPAKIWNESRCGMSENCMYKCVYQRPHERKKTGGERSMYRFSHNRKSALCFRVDFDQSLRWTEWDRDTERVHFYEHNISLKMLHTIAAAVGWLSLFCVFRLIFYPIFLNLGSMWPRFPLCAIMAAWLLDLYQSFSLTIYCIKRAILMLRSVCVVWSVGETKRISKSHTTVQ